MSSLHSFCHGHYNAHKQTTHRRHRVGAPSVDHHELGKHASLLPLALQVEVAQRLDAGAAPHCLAEHYCLPLRAVVDLRRYCLRVLLPEVTRRGRGWQNPGGVRSGCVSTHGKRHKGTNYDRSPSQVSRKDNQVNSLSVHRKLGHLDYAERSGYLPVDCETGSRALRDLRIAKDWYVLQSTIKKNISHPTTICFSSAETNCANHQVEINSECVNNQENDSYETKHICRNGLNNNHLFRRNSIENLHETNNILLESQNCLCEHKCSFRGETKCRVHFSTNDAKLDRENYPYKDDLIEKAITQLSHSLNISNLKDQPCLPQEQIVAKLFSTNFGREKDEDNTKSYPRKFHPKNHFLQVVHDKFDHQQNQKNDNSDSTPKTLRSTSSVSEAEAVLCCSKLLEYCSSRTQLNDHYWEYIRNISKLIEDVAKNRTSVEDAPEEVAHMSFTPRTKVHHQFTISDKSSDLQLDTRNFLHSHTYYCTKRNCKKD